MKLKLKQLRASKGWTQQEAADQIGISIDHVKKMELGRVDPSLKTVRKIYKLFECKTVDQVLEAS